MATILDPSNTADDAAFEGINDIMNINATAAQINANPLFLYAEEYTLQVYPAGALPGGRGDPNRTDVVRGLQFLTAYNFTSGGGSSATFQSAGGNREIDQITESVGPVTKTTRYGEFGASVSKVITHGVEDRAAFLLSEAYQIFLMLNPNWVIPDHHQSIIPTPGGGGVNVGAVVPVSAATTDSREVDFNHAYYAYWNRFRNVFTNR